ncbi:MAG: transporter substrate-binding domain-containing protein [Bdellovibrionales bacterium]|nr:transporter substrate-binding domain-containing protein [Bdellovibrionales bacterium]
MLKKLVMFPLALSVFSYSALACEIKVSFEEWVPYQTKSAGKMGGLDVEITEAIAKEAGCKVTFVDLPWTRQLSENEAGNLDVTMGASRTPEREAFATFTDGYRNETNSLFVKKGAGSDIKALADLGNTKLKIGIARGTSYGPAVDAMKGKFDGSADNDDLNVKKTVAGRIDGFLVDQFTGFAIIKSQNASDKIELHPVEISSGEVYLMVSKKSKVAGLKDKLNDALKKIKADGTQAKIIAKYK